MPTFGVNGKSAATRIDKVKNELHKSRGLTRVKTVFLYTIGFSAENCPNKVLKVTSPSDVRYVCYTKGPIWAIVSDVGKKSAKVLFLDMVHL